MILPVLFVKVVLILIIHITNLLTNMDDSLLFRLPLEVREMIYDHYFSGMSISVTCKKLTVINIKSQPLRTRTLDKHYTQHSWTAVDNFRWIQHRLTNKLLLLCKQIYQEADRVFWRQRSLVFIIDRTLESFKRSYHIQDRIKAMCCIRKYLLRLATKHPVAISGLDSVTLQIAGFDYLDMPEMYDIMSQTQKLLGNWRLNSQALPFWFHLTEVFDLIPASDRPYPASHSVFPKSTTIEFHLPVHDMSAWNTEISKRVRTARNGLKKVQGNYDDNWVNWCLDMLEWSLLNFHGSVEDCSLQRGCHCEKHIGRTQLSREAGELQLGPDPEVPEQI